MATVQIEDGALGVALAALNAQVELASEEAKKSVYERKSPDLAAIWAKLAVTFGRAYLSLKDATFL